MDQILAKLHRRKEFYTIVILLCVCLISIRYFIIPYFAPILTRTIWEGLADVTDKCFISMVIAVFIGSFVFWLTPDVVRNAKVETVEPREIGTLFTDALHTSTLWWYNGGCGRYFRVKTLPEMAKEARQRSLSREVNGLILDPRDDIVFEQYARYRRGVRSAESGKEWTIKRVKQELLATIIKTAIVKREEPHLRVKLGLIRHFSSVRFDLSSDFIILTKEDKFSPAIRFDAGTHFYQWYRDELMLTEQQSEAAPDLQTHIKTDTVTGDDVKNYMRVLKIVEDYFTETELNEITLMIKESKSPYA